MGVLDPNITRLKGSTAAGDDVTGAGDDASVDLGVSVNYVDFYNGGTDTATVSDGAETRSVPSGSGRLCEFSATAQTFAVTANGPWIATPSQ